MIDKDSLQLDRPRRTPDHPTKSHVVKTMVDGSEKIIRFGEQGASTAGKPKEGESDAMKAKRASFKARHGANIAKGKSSPAYWADKVKWAKGGSVSLEELDQKYEGIKKPDFENLRALNSLIQTLQQSAEESRRSEFDPVAATRRRAPSTRSLADLFASYEDAPMASHAGRAEAGAKDPKRTETAKMVFDSFKNAGFSDAQAKALTAEINREGSFNPAYLYGSHTDAANNATNVGMLSWQGDRANRLMSFMSDRGLIDPAGRIAPGQDALNAQAEYLRWEMENDPSYAKTRETFLANPEIDQETAHNILGKNFIRWRIDDPKYRGSGFDRISEGYDLLNMAQGFAKGGLAELTQKYDRGGEVPAPKSSEPETSSLTGFPEIDRMIVALGNVNQMFNPIEAIGDSMDASKRMLAPETEGWDRVAALGDMLSGVGGVVAPVATAARAGTPAAAALMESLLGGSPTMTAVGDIAPVMYADAIGTARALASGDLEFMRGRGLPQDAIGVGADIVRKPGERFIISGSDYFDPPMGDAGRARDPAMFSPFSSTKHGTAPSEFFVAGTDLGGLEVPTIVSPSEIQKLYDRIYFATGDRTSNRRSIEEINDIILSDPTITYGGPEYIDQLRAWASEPNAMAAKANAFQEVPEGIRAMLAYMPMGQQSGDFSDHMAKTFGNVTKRQMAGNMAPALREISKIDRLIAEKFPELKNVPSVASEGFGAWLSSLKGGKKAELVKAFDKANFKGLGMPDVSAVRFAITNPDLVHSDALSIGYRMSEPDASKGIIRSTEHPTYGAYLPMAEGTKNMSLGYELPWYIGARDTALPKIKPGGPIYALPKDIKSYMGNPQLYQKPDQQWVDESSTYGDLLANKGRRAASDYGLGLLEKYWKSR